MCCPKNELGGSGEWSEGDMQSTILLGKKKLRDARDGKYIAVRVRWVQVADEYFN